MANSWTRRTLLTFIGVLIMGKNVPTQNMADRLVLDCEIIAADLTHDPWSFELRHLDGATAMVMGGSETALAQLLRDTYYEHQRLEIRLFRG